MLFACTVSRYQSGSRLAPLENHNSRVVDCWNLQEGLQENLLQKPRSPRRKCCSARSRGRALHFPSPPQGHVCWDAMRCKSPRRPAGCKEAAYSGKGGNVYLRGGVSWYVNALSGLAIIRVYCHIPATVLYHYIFPWSYPPFSSE